VTASARGAVSPWLLVVTGPAGQEVARAALRPGVPLTIGRAPECAVMLGVMAVARRHGRIELVNGVPVYSDEPGAAGTLLDGDPVSGSVSLGERTVLEIGGFRFAMKRERPAVAAPAGEPAAPQWTCPSPGEGGTLLDRHISGLRMYRNETEREKEDRRQKWEADWKQLVGQAREIQARYGRHPRVLEFALSKDERELVVKLRDSSARGYAYFCLSRQHPEGLYPEQQAVWLRELGRGDESFSEPMRGFDELMSRLAPRLA
jgi:pSer/pThr/pTyr-binding forkhead associated (FHA) protein